MLTVDQLNQALALVSFLGAVQSLRQRLAATGSVSFGFSDGHAPSSAITDHLFVGAFANFLVAQEVSISARLNNLGVNPT